jgi:hypothetical protein
MAMKDLEARLEQLEQQNALLLSVLQRNGGISQAEEKEIVNNGWRVLYNPDRPNPDNRDWPAGTPKKWDPDKGYKVGYNTFHVEDGMWEWGYENPETGEITWSGKLIGEKPSGPPAEPPVPLELLRS